MRTTSVSDCDVLPLPSGTVVSGVKLTNPVALRKPLEQLQRMHPLALAALEEGGHDDLLFLPDESLQRFVRSWASASASEKQLTDERKSA